MSIPTTIIRGGLLAILATTMLAGCGSEAPAPTASPTVDASASPSATPAPPTFTGGVAPGEVTIDPSLPDALPLPDGIWDDTGPGWVLATFRPSVYQWHRDDENAPDLSVEATVQVVYLVSPEGVRYQVLELDPSQAITVESWSAGESRAYVWYCPGTQDNYCDDGSTNILDLGTGAMAPTDAPPGADAVAFTLPGPMRVWTSNAQFIVSPGVDGTFLERNGEFTELGDGWTIQWGPSPDGAWLGLDHWEKNGDAYTTTGDALASLVTGEMVAIPEPTVIGCGFVEWREGGTLLLNCLRDDEQDGITSSEDVWFVFDPSTGAMTEIPRPVYSWEEPIVSHNVLVSPGVWAGGYGFGDPEMWDLDATFGIDDHGTPIEVDIFDANGVRLETTGARTAVGGVVYISGQHAPGDMAGVASVIAYKPATGSQVVLLPEPPRGPTVDFRDAYGGVDVWGVTSWVVAP